METDLQKAFDFDIDSFFNQLKQASQKIRDNPSIRDNPKFSQQIEKLKDIANLVPSTNNEDAIKNITNIYNFFQNTNFIKEIFDEAQHLESLKLAEIMQKDATEKKEFEEKVLNNLSYDRYEYFSYDEIDVSKFVTAVTKGETGRSLLQSVQTNVSTVKKLSLYAQFISNYLFENHNIINVFKFDVTTRHLFYEIISSIENLNLIYNILLNKNFKEDRFQYVSKKLAKYEKNLTEKLQKRKDTCENIKTDVEKYFPSYDKNLDVLKLYSEVTFVKDDESNTDLQKRIEVFLDKLVNIYYFYKFY